MFEYISMYDAGEFIQKLLQDKFRLAIISASVAPQEALGDTK